MSFDENNLTNSCPECGCPEVIPYLTNTTALGYKVCQNCHQEWYTDVIYPEHINLRQKHRSNNMNDYDFSIHQNPDAKVWAGFFMQTMKEKSWSLDDIDEEIMFGWFANAMMAMHDHVYNHKLAEHDADLIGNLKEQICELKEEVKNLHRQLGLKYKAPIGVVGYARKEELEECLNDHSSHFYLGLDHPDCWEDDAHYEWLVPLCAVNTMVEHDAEVIAKFVEELEGMGFVHETGIYGTVWAVDLEDVKHRANQLHLKAQESTND